ncbi:MULTISPECIES: hypothetical protein [unclassified Micromonospora]|uniref:hypothetical protein n=1 Tax=unclassified Micromonospora TaxID=2617518 RepID=UPI003A8BF414
MDSELPAPSDILDHPDWCDLNECTAGGPSEFHPESSPPAHWGHRHPCNPQPGRYPTEVAVQLVRFVDDPPKTDFIRVELGSYEERRSHYLRLAQGAAMRDVLNVLLTQTQTGRDVTRQSGA